MQDRVPSIPKTQAQLAAIVLVIGAGNSKAATGYDLRYWVTQSRAGKLTAQPIRVGGRLVYIASELLDAIAALRISTPARPIRPEAGSVAELDDMREQLAARLRSAGGGR